MKTIDRFSKYIVIRWFAVRQLYKDIFKSAIATLFYIIFCKILEYKGYQSYSEYAHILWFCMALFYFNQSNVEDHTRLLHRERECIFNYSIDELELMTERIKRSALEIENREKFLRTILKSLTEGMIGVSMKGTIKLCNPAASRLFGYGVNELINTSVCSLFPEVFDENRIDEILNASEDYQNRIRTMALCKNGTAMEIEITVSKIKKDLRDFVIITTRKPMEQKGA